jgi:outer membrane protein
MKKNKLIISSALLTMSLCLPSMASSLLDVYEISLNSDPILKQAISTKRSVAEGKEQAFSYFLPNINGGADVTRIYPNDLNNGDNYNDKVASVSLVQSIYDNKNYVNNRISKLNFSSASSDLIQAEQDLISRVINAYFDVLLAGDTVEFTKAEQKAIERQLDQSKKRYEVGIIAITDVLEAQAGFDNATADVLKAENELQISREKLRDIAGQYFDKLSPVIEDMPLFLPEPNNIETWVEYSIETNPALQSINYLKQSSKENISLQRSGHYPYFDAVARYSTVNTGRQLSSNGSDGSISIQMTLPIYQGGFVNSKTRQAVDDLETVSNRAEEIRRTTERLTRSSFLSVVSEITRVKALKQAVLSNESALKATEAGLDVGTRTIVDVLNVQRDRFAARKNYSEARYNYIRATIFLKQFAGLLEEKDLVLINSWLQN